MRDELRRFVAGEILPLSLLMIWILAGAAILPGARAETAADLGALGPLIWSSFLGGEGIDHANCLCLDAEGNAFVGGKTRSVGFPNTRGLYEEHPFGGSEAFVAKFNAKGDELIWCRTLGGSADEDLFALCIAESGALYCAGVTTSEDFPTTPGSFQREHRGFTDLFVAALDPENGELHWSTLLGGSRAEMMRFHLLCDDEGHPILAGSTSSEDFPTTSGAYDESFNGGAADVFVTKLDASGSCLHWSSFLGGERSDLGLTLAMDPEGDLLLAGATQSPDFPVVPGSFDVTLGGGCDSFVAKLSADGRRLIWASYLGGDGESSSEEARALAVDGRGNPVLAGVTSSADFPTTPNGFEPKHSGVLDGFVCKLDATGSRLLWSTFIGGVGDDRIEVLALDVAGRPLLAGSSASFNYPTTADAFSRSHAGGELDVVASCLDATGSKLLWSSFLGGSAEDMAFALAFVSPAEFLLAGLTGSATGKYFPVTPGSYDETHNGWDDAFVCKLSLSKSTDSRSSGDAVRKPCLNAKHPDPDHTQTEIRFELSMGAKVTLAIYDPSGCRLRTLIRGEHFEEGDHRLFWDGRDEAGRNLASGIYLYRLEVGSRLLSGKMLLLK